MINWESLAVGGAAITAFGALWSGFTLREGPGPDRWLASVLMLVCLNIVHPLVFTGATPGALWIEPLQYALPLAVLAYLKVLTGRPGWGWEWSLMVVPVLFLGAEFMAWRGLSAAFWVGLLVTSAALGVPIVGLVHRHRQQLEEEYSSLEGVDAGWVTALAGGLTALFGLYTLGLGMVLHAPAEFPMRLALSLGMAALGVWLTWKAVRRQPRVRVRAPRTATSPADATRLEALIRSRKLFLDPDLTLDQLALVAGLSRHEASATLNHGLGESFYDQINRLRVEEFQRLCRDPQRAQDKILTLAFDAGFRSKPAFNAIFKKMTGLTPSQFRQTATIESRPIR